jgi:hypothetical protein
MPVDPPRDANGKIVPHNHSEIFDEHHVIRRTVPLDLCDDARRRRLSSGAFSESSDGGMSVDLEVWMRADGLEPLHYATDPTHGAVRLNVGELRRLGFQVGWDPDGGHRHHGAVWGIGPGSKRKKRVQKIATTIRRAEGEDARTLEAIPVFAADGSISAFEVYVLEGPNRTNIGSRTTLVECREAYEAYCRAEAPYTNSSSE